MISPARRVEFDQEGCMRTIATLGPAFAGTGLIGDGRWKRPRLAQQEKPFAFGFKWWIGSGGPGIEESTIAAVPFARGPDPPACCVTAPTVRCRNEVEVASVVPTSRSRLPRRSLSASSRAVFNGDAGMVGSVGVGAVDRAEVEYDELDSQRCLEVVRDRPCGLGLTYVSVRPGRRILRMMRGHWRRAFWPPERQRGSLGRPLLQKRVRTCPKSKHNRAFLWARDRIALSQRAIHGRGPRPASL